MYKYEVTEVKMVSSNAVLITLKAEDRMRQLDYRSGQYAAVSFMVNGRPTNVRCFSIVTSASQKGVLQFAMRVTGRFTKTASRLRVGDRATVQGPFGDFTLENGTSQNAIFFAGGIGVTPFISMLRDATRRSSNKGLTLVYSCQSQDDIPFGTELAELEHDNPNVTIIYVIARGEIGKLGGKKVIQGMLTPAGIDKIMRGNYDPYDYYICGPTGYMKAIKKALLDKQVDPETVFTEEFGVKTRGLPSLRSSLSGRVYLGTAAGLVLAVLMVTGIDLKSTIAKATVTTPATTSSPASTSTTSSTDDSGSTYTTPSSSDSTTTPTTTQQQTQTTYQQPVSTVS